MTGQRKPPILGRLAVFHGPLTRAKIPQNLTDNRSWHYWTKDLPSKHPTPPSPTLIHHASYHITHSSIPQKIQTFSSDSKPDVFIDDNEETLTIIPPLPDFDKPPYAKPIGPVFQEPEWTDLANRLHDKNVQLLTACVSIATILNLPITTLRPTHLHRNVIELGETVVREITRSSWYISYKLLTINYTWEELLEEGFILETIKRNVRMSQPIEHMENACEILLSLGFTDDWLYEWGCYEM